MIDIVDDAEKKFPHHNTNSLHQIVAVTLLNIINYVTCWCNSLSLFLVQPYHVALQHHGTVDKKREKDSKNVAWRFVLLLNSSQQHLLPNDKVQRNSTWNFLKFFSVFNELSTNQHCKMKFQTFLMIFVTISFTVATASKILPLVFPDTNSEIFFDCRDNKYISRELLCDGHDDCTNGADEEFCDIRKWEQRRW